MFRLTRGQRQRIAMASAGMTGNRRTIESLELLFPETRRVFSPCRGPARSDIRKDLRALEMLSSLTAPYIGAEPPPQLSAYPATNVIQGVRVQDDPAPLGPAPLLSPAMMRPSRPRCSTLVGGQMTRAYGTNWSPCTRSMWRE